MNTTFDTLIHRILQERDINLTKLYKELADLGLNITYPSLYAYYTGTTVPPYSMAKQILKLARYQLSNDDLEQVLAYSKKVNKAENKEKNNELHINLKIKPKNIHSDYKNNADGLKTIIEMRADELFGNDDEISSASAGGKRKISSYLSYLIKKDLEENGFIESEDKNNG